MPRSKTLLPALLMVALLTVGFTSASLIAKEPPAKKTVRVLTIGNSFAGNACKYLKQIAEAEGSTELRIGTANLGGCTLERHWSLADASASDPTVQPYGYGDKKLSLQEYLEVEPWDYVTVQQMSALSFKPESYHPYIERLAETIKKHAPQAKILVHQTWAYRQDAPLLKQWGITQQEMYKQLVGAYDAIAESLQARQMPVGDAFQIARNTPGREVLVYDPDYNYDAPQPPQLPKQTNSLVAGQYWSSKSGKPMLALDFKHGNNKGCLLAGLVWYEVLTGNDARESTYVPSGLQEEDVVYLREAAHAAVSGKPAK
ncbi:DUF4886 domain-containing protein [Lignipirellula cremea]|uniref:DUF4886 domain-containing protein n=1 Tax=Lignipirellula cremea TaxID=2528010 RepID=A0A518DLV6_9BACT|nr:DUF4886 domain-containing protein [Lignipirellula cremea]QDU92819.1 hypothetical protein Pla8534_05920 [Lignipirellula cremea]